MIVVATETCALLTVPSRPDPIRFRRAACRGWKAYCSCYFEAWLRTSSQFVELLNAL
jgi:hypothetical protein